MRAGHTAKRFDCSRGYYNRVNLVDHLVYDFSSGCRLMKTWVRTILKLLGHEAVLDIESQFSGAMKRSFHYRFVGDIVDLSPERFDQLHFFNCKPLGDAENNTISACNTYQR